MSECIFHIGLTGVYAALAIEAWRMNHRRAAFCYGLAACLSLAFAMGPLSWPTADVAEVWA